MNLIRKILYPLSLIYGLITKLRNWAFDKGIIRSKKFNIPTIVVGNLNVGGTGKSPQIEYLIRLLTPNYDTAVLSRGYGRKSKGFLLADKNSNADHLGLISIVLHPQKQVLPVWPQNGKVLIGLALPQWCL